MTTVIQEITHPMIEEMQVIHEREIAEIRSQMQDKIDELTDKVETAESSIFNQGSWIEEIKSKILDAKKEDKKFTLSSLVKEFNNQNSPVNRSEKDWDVLCEMEKLLLMVEPDVVYIREGEKIVYKTPEKLIKAIKELQEYI